MDPSLYHPESDDAHSDWPVCSVDVPQGGRRVVATRDVGLTATLGSCVSVCLFSTNAGIGGMNHIFKSVSQGALGGASVVVEMEYLVNDLMQQGVPRSDLSARIAGGARVLLRGRQHGLAIADVCLRYLDQEGIPILGASIGGKKGRRIKFHPATGRLIVGFLPAGLINQAIPPEENSNPAEIFGS